MRSWTHVLAALDLLSRAAFFLIAPFLLAVLGAVLPITGVVVNVGLTVAIAMFDDELIVRWGHSIPIVGKSLLTRQQLEDYYRAHPPKPFLYYLFYPLMFPYWLVSPIARREFLLYRRFKSLALAILVGSALLEYVTLWRPELPPRLFLRSAFAMFVVQILVTMIVLMPLATSIVGYHLRGRKKSLRLLVIVGILSGGLGALTAHVTFLVSGPTQQRIRLRTQAAPDRAHAAERAALDAARADLHGDDTSGLVGGAALHDARHALRALYKRDEANGFRLFATNDGALILFASGNARHDPTWLAIDRDGRELTDPASLPDDLRKLMRFAH
jgi:hypothetical protein